MDGGDCKLEEVFTNLFGIEIAVNESRAVVPDSLV
jgi:hypothetical protein